MSSPVYTTPKERKEVKWINVKITAGFFVTDNIEYMEEKSKEGRRICIRKEVVGCVQDVVEKNNF